MASLIRRPLLAWLMFTVTCSANQAEMGEVQIHVVDVNGGPLPCRIHLADEQGEPQEAPGLPFWRDHFVCDGVAKLELPPGQYSYAVHRGPEYESDHGTLEIHGNQTTALDSQLERINNLRNRGWYAADLHVHRDYTDIELLVRAADLDFAPVITWWNANNPWAERPLPSPLLRQFDGHRLVHLMAGEDERRGGALLYFGMKKPIDITGGKPEEPSPLDFVQQAVDQQPDVWIDIEKPFWWDVPTWLASGKVKSIGIANNHMCHNHMYEDEAWGKPRDDVRLPPPTGNGYWTQEIYYHILNCGLRIPPTAGSASGVLRNPVGYNRVYVHLDEPFSHDAWWQALSKGRCFVTNGPQLICTANGQLPGSVLKAATEETATVNISIELSSEDRIKELAIIRDGRIARTIPCNQDVRKKFSASLEFDRPGWFLVRAIADNDQTFRFGSTGPFYVTVGEQAHTIHRSSVEFFQTWVNERMQVIKKAILDPESRASVLAYHLRAKEFWAEKANIANR